MNIEIPIPANGTPTTNSNIVRLQKTVWDAIQEYIIPRSEISRINSEIIEECMWDIADFSRICSEYIEREWFNQSYGQEDDELISDLILFFEWKGKNNHLLTHHAISWNITSIEQKIHTIQKLLLWKLWIDDHVVQWSDPWDRIAFEIEKIKAA